MPNLSSLFLKNCVKWLQRSESVFCTSSVTKSPFVCQAGKCAKPERWVQSFFLHSIFGDYFISQTQLDVRRPALVWTVPHICRTLAWTSRMRPKVFLCLLGQLFLYFYQILLRCELLSGSYFAWNGIPTLLSCPSEGAEPPTGRFLNTLKSVLKLLEPKIGRFDSLHVLVCPLPLPSAPHHTHMSFHDPNCFGLWGA